MILHFPQGDGTAFIFADNDSVFTFSMHCEKNFPLKKQQSDLDVGLDFGLNDEQYLKVVRDYLPWLLDTFRPDLVLYDAGVDTHQDDELGKLCLTDQGKKDQTVTLSKYQANGGKSCETKEPLAETKFRFIYQLITVYKQKMREIDFCSYSLL